MIVIDLSSHKIQSCACTNVSIQGNLQTESSKCSKWGKEEIVIDLSSNFNPVHAQTCPFKGNLPAENAPVQSVASGERMKKYDCKISHHTKFNPVHAQTCPFKGNLQAENAPVQSAASGERRK